MPMRLSYNLGLDDYATAAKFMDALIYLFFISSLSFTHFYRYFFIAHDAESH